MKKPGHWGRTGVLVAIALLIVLGGPCSAHAQVGFFGDDFNRPDGPVGNGWTTFAVASDTGGDPYVVQDPRIAIEDEQLAMPGVDRYASGIFRPLGNFLIFPVVFSYDFRTDDPGGGWTFALNVKNPTSMPPPSSYLPYPPYTPAQVGFFQASGTSVVQRVYRTAIAPFFGTDVQPAVVGPDAGIPRPYGTEFAKIGARIEPDLSATIIIDYNDGGPAVRFVFPPAIGAHPMPSGNVLTAGSSAGPLKTDGHYFFDNLQFFDQAPQPPPGGGPPPTGVITVSIDVKPGSPINPVNLKSRGVIQVAILSSPDFDAPADVDRSTLRLRFGHSGAEASLRGCQPKGRDVSKPKDHLADLVCSFYTEVADFSATDTKGTLTGVTLTGQPFIGTDKITVKPNQ
jgi:hypothetical protein